LTPHPPRVLLLSIDDTAINVILLCCSSECHGANKTQA